MKVMISSVFDWGGFMKRKLKIKYNSPVVISFLVICLLVTLVGAFTNNESTVLYFSVYRNSLTNPMTYLRFLTHVFGHVGYDHFVGNAMYLLLLGPMLEEKYGSLFIFKVIFCTAFVTGILHFVIFENISLCGASGIVFAFIVLASITQVKGNEIPLSFILIVILFLGKEFIAGITVDDTISNFAHVLGGIIGGIMGYLFNKKG